MKQPPRPRGSSETEEPHRDQTSPSSGREVERARAPRSLDRALRAADAPDVLGSHEDDEVATGLEERLRERQRARRSLLATRSAIAAGVGLVLAGLLWAAFASPLFQLRADSIEVSGATGGLDAEDVRTAVAPFVGTPLTRLDLEEVSEAVGSLQLVREVDVARAWPDGLVVTVAERGAAMGEQAADSVRLVDDQGIVVREDGDLPDGLPLAELPQDGPSRTAAAADVAAVWNALDDSLRDQVASIGADGHTVTLALTGSRTAVWGTAEDSDLKARVLAVLLAERPASTYDVSAPTRPVTS